MKMKYNIPTFVRCSKSISKRQVYIDNAYFKKHEKSQINNLTLCFKELEKEEQYGKAKS